MTRRLPIVCLAVLLAALAGCAEEAPPAADAPAAVASEQALAEADDPAAPAAQPPARATREPRRAPRTDGDSSEPERPRALARLEQLQERREQRQRWWNDAELIEAAGINETQRGALDLRFDAHQQQVQQATTERQQAQRDYQRALRENDLVAARAAAERNATLLAEHARRQQLLTIDTLEMLDPAQRRTLIDDHAGRLLRGGGPGAGAMGALRGGGEQGERREKRRARRDGEGADS